MTDFAQLVVAVDATGADRGSASLDRLAVTAERTEQRGGRAMRHLSRDMRAAGNAARPASMGLRNLGLQLGQVTQQGSVTGNYLQALAIQMPDILMSFGMWGIGLGVVAGALTGVASSMGLFSSSSDEAGDALDELEVRIRDVRTEIEGLSSGNLFDTFGEFTADVQALARSGLEISLRAQADAARDLSDALAYQYSQGAFSGSRREQLHREFGLNAELIQQITNALDAIDSSGSIESQVDAASNLRETLLYAFGSIEDMSEEQLALYSITQDTEDAWRRVGDAVNDATDATSAMADESARALRNLSASFRAQNATGGGGRGSGSEYYGAGGGEFNYTGPRLVQDADGNWVPQQRRTGGGGMSDAQRRQNEAMREAQRIYDATRTSAEAYATELADLNELLAMGYLDADTHARAVAALADEYSGAADALDGMDISARGLGESFGEILGNARSLEDVLGGMQNLLGSLASQFLSAGFGQLFGTMFPSLNLATGGVSGGAVAGASAARGGGSVVNIVNNTGQPVESRTSMRADGTAQTDAIIGRSIASGRQDGTMARYGAKPRGISR